MALTKELLKEKFIYDNGVLYWKNPQKRVHAGSVAGSFNKTTRCVIFVDGKQHYRSRLVFLWHHGYLPEFVDHINRIKSDDRIENLREVTHAQNMQNLPSRQNSTSKYIGVSRSKTTTKGWIASLKVGSKVINLGRFKTEDEAALIYNKAAKKHRGRFANLNIIKTEIYFKREILTASYWEHFKAAKDLAMLYPIEHPKRLSVEAALNDIQTEINSLKKYSDNE